MLSNRVYSQYPVFSIPENLKKNADVIVRDYNMVLEVRSEARMKVTKKIAYTILNKEGDDEALFYVYYDPSKNIKSLKGYIYSSGGKLMKKIPEKDFNDQSVATDFEVYDDRIKYYSSLSNHYPYTIVFEYEMDYDGYMEFPDWQPMDSERKAIEKASMTVKMPTSLDLRYKNYNFKESKFPEIDTQEEGLKTYHWELKNIPAIKSEPYGKGFDDICPWVQIAPLKFFYDGYLGNMTTWDDYAMWYYQLNQPREELPNEVKEKVKTLVNPGDSPKERTRKIYEYLQSHTRYVSIQLGIGGWQAFPAETTSEKGYGDCKALSTYTKAMLKEVGVDAYYVLVNAGRQREFLDIDFPGPRFNHVFLSVPLDQDTLWLECTSQTNPFGYLGKFTSDRTVLFVRKDGGDLIRTPKYSAEQSAQVRSALVVLDEQGNARTTVKTSYAGIQYSNNGINHYIRQSKEDQRKWLYKNVDIPSFDVVDFSFEEYREGENDPVIVENLDLILRKYASVSGKRMFITPNIMNRYTWIPEKSDGRKTELVIHYDYMDIDSIVIKIPEEYRPENITQGVEINSKFGSYSSSLERQDDGSFLYVRKAIILEGVYPPESYDDFVEFRKKIARADKAKMVMINTT